MWLSKIIAKMIKIKISKISKQEHKQNIKIISSQLILPLFVISKRIKEISNDENEEKHIKIYSKGVKKNHPTSSKTYTVIQYQSKIFFKIEKTNMIETQEKKDKWPATTAHFQRPRHWQIFFSSSWKASFNSAHVNQIPETIANMMKIFLHVIKILSNHELSSVDSESSLEHSRIQGQH